MASLKEYRNWRRKQKHGAAGSPTSSGRNRNFRPQQLRPIGESVVTNNQDERQDGRLNLPNTPVPPVPKRKKTAVDYTFDRKNTKTSINSFNSKGSVPEFSQKDMKELRHKYERQLEEEKNKTQDLLEQMEKVMHAMQSQMEEIKSSLPRPDSPQGATIGIKGISSTEQLNPNELLLEYARQGNVKECQKVLSMIDVDGNCMDERNMTPLLYLIEYFDQDEDFYNFPGHQRRNILAQVVKSLIRRGANVNQTDSDGRSPLWLVAAENELDILKIMIETESNFHEVHDVNQIDFIPNPNHAMLIKRKTYHHHETNSDISQLSQDDVPDHYWTIWHIAIEKESSEMLELLMKAQLQGETVCRKLSHEHNEIDPELWTNKAHNFDRTAGEVWKKDGSPLHVAIEMARNEGDAAKHVRLLLEDKPLNQDNDTFMTLFSPHAVDENNQTALHLACSKGYSMVVSQLLQYCYHYKEHHVEQFDINMQDASGMTPLMHAIDGGHSNVVEQLFSRVNLDCEMVQQHQREERKNHLWLRSTFMDHTALHKACSHVVEMDEVVLNLCKNKADVNLQDAHGFSALHLSSMYGHIMIVTLLLKYNANVASVGGQCKETALHLAAAAGHINVVSILLRNGAEVAAENSQGRTALHHAFSLLTLFFGIKIYLEKRQQGCLHDRYYPQIPETFMFTDHPSCLDYKSLLSRLMEDPEQLHLAIDSQNMLIKMLLDAGANLDHEDKIGDTAFITDARKAWFRAHYFEMFEICNHPIEMGYDSEVFIDKRTQAAVKTMWILTGQRTQAMMRLLNWILFVCLLTVICIGYSGNDAYDTFAFEAGAKEIVVNEEWDDIKMKTLHDVANIDDWKDYLEKSLIPGLSSMQHVYHHSETGDLQHLNQETMLGHVSLLGKARYRQLRTKHDSCSSSIPSLIYSAEETCFAPASTGTRTSVLEKHEDRNPIQCEGVNGGSIEWTETPAYHTWGRFGFYRNNGFIVEIPRNYTEAIELLHNLNDPRCSFISLNTRAAIVEFTLYNRAQELFSHVRVYLELTTSGAVYGGSNWDTVKLISYKSDNDYSRLAAEVLWAIMVIRYIYKECHSMIFDRWENKYIVEGNVPRLYWLTLKPCQQAKKLAVEDPKIYKIVSGIPFTGKTLMTYKTSRVVPPYLVNMFNYMDMLIMTLIVLLAVYHGLAIKVQNRYLEDWKSPNIQESYYDISELLWLVVWRQHLLAFLVFLCYLKILEFIQVSATFAIPVIVIRGMAVELMTFFFIFLVFLGAFGMYEYVLYSLTYSSARTTLLSVITTFRASLGDIDFDGIQEVDRTLGILYTVILAFILVILLLNLLIAVMNEAYEEVKATAEARWCYMQFRMIVATAGDNPDLDIPIHDPDVPPSLERSVSIELHEEKDKKRKLFDFPWRRSTVKPEKK